MTYTVRGLLINHRRAMTAMSYFLGVLVFDLAVISSLNRWILFTRGAFHRLSVQPESTATPFRFQCSLHRQHHDLSFSAVTVSINSTSI